MLAHVAYSTADAGALRSYLASRGTKVGKLGGGKDGDRWFSVRDPEGNEVRFVQSGAPVESSPSAISGRIIHVGYLVHSRGGAAMPLDVVGAGIQIMTLRHDEGVRIREDLDVPVLVLQTETDVLGRLRYLPARQPDTPLLRVWEVAGAAHADAFVIGPFADLLGCPEPVNNGQLVFVARAALHHLDRWVADGTEPPFADQTFDTVVTPWFIDQVPPDRPQFLTRIGRQLKPDGRWLNVGPLLYPPETPMSRRYAREEVFALAHDAGFHVDRWAAASRPYLVTPLNGRGKVEWVLTFLASRQAS